MGVLIGISISTILIWKIYGISPLLQIKHPSIRWLVFAGPVVAQLIIELRMRSERRYIEEVRSRVKKPETVSN